MAVRLLSLGLLLAVVGSTMATLSYGGAELDPNFPGRCLYEGFSYSFTEHTDVPLKCESARCVFAGTNVYVQFKSCTVLDADPECTVIDGNFTLKHPECCPYVVCGEGLSSIAAST